MGIAVPVFVLEEEDEVARQQAQILVPMFEQEVVDLGEVVQVDEIVRIDEGHPLGLDVL